MNQIEFGKYLRSLRKAKKLTLIELSKASDVSNPYISQIENGKFKPSNEILYKLAEPLGVSYFDLMVAAGYLNNHFIDNDNSLTEQGREAARIAAKLNQPMNEKEENLINPESFPQPTTITRKINVPFEYKINGETRKFSNSDILDLYYLIKMSLFDSKLLELKFKDEPLTDKDKQKIISIIDILLN